MVRSALWIALVLVLFPSLAAATPVTLGFEPNRGQAAPRTAFVSTGVGPRVSLYPGGFSIGAEEVRFVGGKGTLVAQDPTAGTSNYLIGANPAGFIRGVPHYGRVRYRDIYPGVDAVVYGVGARLEYDLVLRPGASLARVELRFSHSADVWIDAEGALVARRADVTLRQRKPTVTQERDGRRVELEARWERRPNGNVGLAVRDRVEGLPLLIDPVVEYSTLTGGATDGLTFGAPDAGRGIAVDAAGNAYIAGTTASSDFPVSPSAFQKNGFPNANVQQQAFVLKLDPGGTKIVYATYLGGVTGPQGAYNGANAIAVDAGGNAYVAGTTAASDFPVVGGVQTTLGGVVLPFSGGDAFVAKLSPDGASLVYSTYLGGADDDRGLAIRVDGSGAAYVAGATKSSNFPTTGSLPKPVTSGALPDAFVAKLNPAGNVLVYSTALAGSYEDEAYAIALDAKGQAYVTGATGSTNFPVKQALQPAIAESSSLDGDAFVAKLAVDGSLLYSTYLGGEGFEAGRAIAVDDKEQVVVTGETNSRSFPTAYAIQPQLQAGALSSAACALGTCTDGFIAKLTADGQGLVFSTYLGGSGDDLPSGLALDATGSAYLTGTTGSLDFPVVVPVQANIAPGKFVDAFALRLSPDGSGLFWSTYLGGSEKDVGNAIALGPTGVHITGSTRSSDWPATAGAAQTTLKGKADIFTSKLTNSGAPGLTVAKIAPSSGGNTGTVRAIVDGSGFAAATVTLVAPGAPDIVARHPRTEIAGQRIGVTLELMDAAPGKRDVVITTADGQSVTLKGGFTVLAGGAPQVWADVLVPSGARVGSTTPVTILFGNTGTVDATLMPLVVEIPKGTEWTSPIPITAPPQPPGIDPIDWSAIPVSFDDGEVTRIPLVLPSVGAGANGALTLHFTFKQEGPATVRVRAALPLVSFAPSPPPNPTSGLRPLDGQLALGIADCALAVVNTVVGLIDLVLPFDCALAATTFLLDVPGPFIENAQKDGNVKFAVMQLVYGAVSVALNCAGVVSPVAKTLSILKLIMDIIDVEQSCGPKPTSDGAIEPLGEAAPPREGTVQVSSSYDPNEKIAAQGAGNQHYVSGREPLKYAIAFENLPKATAPAREVVITDVLHADLDLDTLEIGAVVVGNRRAAPGGPVTDFSGWLDARDDSGLLVRVEAHLDKPTRKLSWKLSSIDPNTGKPPANALAGFLPPNTEPPLGQGLVIFTASARAGAPTGTKITNQASIVFDTNAPIETQAVSNTIDRDPPSSKVAPIEPGQSASGFEVTWSGTDEGSGIFDTTIFVSEDGGEPSVWLRDTTETKGTFKGKPGKKYAFFSVARDRAGNSETPPAKPDATFPTAEGAAEEPDGCGCRVAGVAGQGASAAPWAMFLVLLALRRFSLRHRASQPSFHTDARHRHRPGPVHHAGRHR